MWSYVSSVFDRGWVGGLVDLFLSLFWGAWVRLNRAAVQRNSEVQ